eukprot:4969207-Pleurochrysis_carterae.AAC.1
MTSAREGRRSAEPRHGGCREEVTERVCSVYESSAACSVREGAANERRRRRRDIDKGKRGAERRVERVCVCACVCACVRARLGPAPLPAPSDACAALSSPSRTDEQHCRACRKRPEPRCGARAANSVRSATSRRQTTRSTLAAHSPPRRGVRQPCVRCASLCRRRRGRP